MYGMKRRRVEVTWILNWQIKEELEKKVNPNNLLVHILKSLKSYVHIASCSRPAGGFNLHECSSTEAKGWMTGWPWKHSEGHWNAVSPVRLRGASLTGHILLFSFLRFLFGKHNSRCIKAVIFSVEIWLFQKSEHLPLRILPVFY